MYNAAKTYSSIHLFYRLATHVIRLDIGQWRNDFMNVSPRTHYTDCTNVHDCKVSLNKNTFNSFFFS